MAIEPTDIVPAEAANRGPMAFTFGDPEPVLDRRELLDHIECWRVGKWYAPPVNLCDLTKSMRSSPHHESALRLKANLLAKQFIPHRLLDRQTFAGVCLDYVVLGNGYLERHNSMTRRAMGLERSLARWTRRGTEEGRFFFLSNGSLGGLHGEHEFEKGTVLQLRKPDLSQEIYGVPEYLSALGSAFLNESATIFRRRYFLNGSHAGYILYLTDAAQQEGDIDALREAMKASKGPGNFRNLFYYSPGGKKDGVQLIPVGEVAAKDEFFNIKAITRDDVLAGHRTPPQVIGVVPANAGGFGDVGKANDMFFGNEIEPLQAEMLAINDWMGMEVVRFRPYEPMGKASPAA